MCEFCDHSSLLRSVSMLRCGVPPLEDADGNGHGTATASIAIGRRYGTATGANAIAVKVVSDSGEAATSDIIAGIQWVINAVKKSGRPSVMDLAWSTEPNTALNQAVTAAINAGISITAAAGDNKDDARYFSPGQGQWFCLERVRVKG